MLRNQPERVHRKVLRKVKKQFVAVTVAGGLISGVSAVSVNAQETLQPAEELIDAAEEAVTEEVEELPNAEIPEEPEAAVEIEIPTDPAVDNLEDVAAEEPETEVDAADLETEFVPVEEAVPEEIPNPGLPETKESNAKEIEEIIEVLPQEENNTAETESEPEANAGIELPEAEVEEDILQEAPAEEEKPSEESIEAAETELADMEAAAVMPLQAEDPYSGRATIIHTNDIHGRIAAEGETEFDLGLAYIQGAADYFRDQGDEVILLDAGDTVHGTTLVNQTDGRAIIDIMNEMEYYAMATGNHEYNFGLDGLLDLENQADFPFLASNVEYRETGEQVFDSFTEWQTYGNNIGIIGLATQDTPVTTHPNNVTDILFTDEIEATEQQLQLLSDQFDHVILLSHAGYEVDRQIAEQVSGIDLIIGGHSHTPLANPVVINGTVITQAWEHTKTFGVIHLDFVDGVLTNREAYLMTSSENLANEEFAFPGIYAGTEGAVRTVEGIVTDPIIEEMVEDVQAEVEESLQTVIGEAAVSLDGERANVRTGETNLGNLITDAVRDFTGADIAIINGGGIRASIEAGEITEGDVLTVLPFLNLVEVQELPGSVILEALEFGVRLYPEQNGGFLHVSGMSYQFDPEQPEGQRIHSVFVGGEELDPEAVYTFATNDFLAVGGDGYTMFADHPVVWPTGLLFSEVLMNYIAAQEGPIAPETEGRIQSAPLPVEQPGEETPGEQPKEEPIVEDGKDKGTIPRKEVTEEEDRAVPGAKEQEQSAVPDLSETNAEGEEAVPDKSIPIIPTGDSRGEKEVIPSAMGSVSQPEAAHSGKGTITDLDDLYEKEAQEQGEKLPDTATATWTIGLAGLISLAGGAASSIVGKKRKNTK